MKHADLTCSLLDCQNEVSFAGDISQVNLLQGASTKEDMDMSVYQTLQVTVQFAKYKANTSDMSSDRSLCTLCSTCGSSCSMGCHMFHAIKAHYNIETLEREASWQSVGETQRHDRCPFCSAMPYWANKGSLQVNKLCQGSSHGKDVC